MIRLLILTTALLCSGCATVYTVSNADSGVVIKGSYCDELQHVMSGTSHNICSLYGQPGDPEGTQTENNLAALAIDSVFSLVADVVILPYTIYKQASSPPIEVN